MKTTELETRIIETLKEGHYPTCDQLLALLNTAEDVRAIKLGKPRLQHILRSMRATGRIEMRADRRLYVHVGPYRCDNMIDTWRVYRKHPHVEQDICIAANMTEAEARTCVTALNTLDRNVRRIKG